MGDERMSDEQLKEIEERAAAATPGPWEWSGDDEHEVLQVRRRDAAKGEFVCVNDYPGGGATWEGESNIIFIAHAREDIPALIVEVRRLQSALARARADALKDAAGKIEALRHPDPLDEPAYDLAIDHAVAAVRTLSEGVDET